MDANTVELLRKNVSQNPTTEMIKAFETMTGQKYITYQAAKEKVEEDDADDIPQIKSRPYTQFYKSTKPVRARNNKGKMCKQIPFEPHGVEHIDANSVIPVSEEDIKLTSNKSKFVMTTRTRPCPLVEVKCDKCGSTDIVNEFVLSGKESYYCNLCCMK